MPDGTYKYQQISQLDAFSKDGANIVFFTAKKTFKVIEYLEEDLLLSDTQIEQIGIIEKYVRLSFRVRLHC